MAKVGAQHVDAEGGSDNGLRVAEGEPETVFRLARAGAPAQRATAPDSDSTTLGDWHEW